jgi:uncharacterized protein
MKFEWDEAKRRRNLAQHGIDFPDAINLFSGRPVLMMPSPYVGEDRLLATGLLGERFITAVFTWRGDTIRLISVRSARRAERREYNENYA